MDDDPQHQRLVTHVVDEMTEAICFVDPGPLRIIYANRGAAEITGFAPNELIGMSPLDLTSEIEPEQLRAAMAAVMATGEALEAEGSLRRRDGALVPVDVLIDRPDDVHILVLTARSTSDRRAIEAREIEARELRARMADRDRIARDLHDTVIQELFGAGLELHSIATRAHGADRERLVAVVDQIDLVIKEIRTTVFGLGARRRLGTSTLDAVLDIVDESTRTLGFRPACRTAGPIDVIVSPEIAEELLPTVRELLTNVARHARASSVDIDLTCDNDTLALVVTDDGVGLGDARENGGHGRKNLAARAERLGGSFRIEAGEPSGVRCTWSVPVN